MVVVSTGLHQEQPLSYAPRQYILRRPTTPSHGGNYRHSHRLPARQQMFLHQPARLRHPRRSPPRADAGTLPRDILPTAHLEVVSMERTSSGETIVSNPPYRPQPVPGSYKLLDNTRVAAAEVREHLFQHRRRLRDRVHERVLLDLINSDVYPTGDDLGRMLDAADSVLFNHRLRNRVRWTWSFETKYDAELIATTALRPARDGGFETLVVLSDRILGKKGRYNPLLLVSTFLHELIHCYLFICCGFKAQDEGPHPHSFSLIARDIDKWVCASRRGSRRLRLCNIRADLRSFEKTAVIINDRASVLSDAPQRSPEPHRPSRVLEAPPVSLSHDRQTGRRNVGALYASPASSQNAPAASPAALSYDSYINPPRRRR